MAYQLVSADEFTRRRPGGIVVGVAISLLLHAALLFAYRQPRPPQAADTAPRSIAVWLRPAEPAPVLKPEPKPEVQPAQPKRRAAPRSEVVAVPKRARSEAESFSVAPSTPTPTAPPARHFDPEAAKALARRLADQPDPAKLGTALERLPEKPLASQTRIERAIASAKRRDCKDGLPGGLLGPLLLLMDKKDSGCKW